MKTYIDKDLALMELKKIREEVMFNSKQYQVMVKAIEKIEQMPNAFLDLETDDCK